MTVNERLKTALEPLEAPMAPGTYTGPAETYLTYNYSLIPVQNGDDRPLFYRALVQVHIVAPLGRTVTPLVKRVMGALLRNEFTAPEMENAGDQERQHMVIESECLVAAEDAFDFETGKDETYESEKVCRVSRCPQHEVCPPEGGQYL